MRACQFDPCERPAFCRGFCTMHYSRWRKHGDPSKVDRGGRPLKGDVPSWQAVHKRLARRRGPAAAHTCIDCNGPAAEWSYDGLDPNELRGPEGGSLLRYSLDLSHYVPRCVRCHRQHDVAHRGADRDETEVLVLRPPTTPDPMKGPPR